MELADCLQMAVLVPAPGIGKSEVKGQASQGCTVHARSAASSPPSAAQSCAFRASWGHEPLAPSVPPGPGTGNVCILLGWGNGG